MFQFRRFPTNCYLIHKGLIEYCSIGFPHSEIHGSRTAFVFPWLIVDRYVLRRLPMPRHSPCALISLTFSELCVLSVFVNFLNVFVVNITLNSFRLDFSRIFWLHYLVVSISHYLYSVFKVHSSVLIKYWWARVDSNHRPHAYQACALTTWATSPFGLWSFPRPAYSIRMISHPSGEYEIRTRDLLLARQALSQLS